MSQPTPPCHTCGGPHLTMFHGTAGARSQPPTQNDCGCDVALDTLAIEFCPLHAQAEALRGVLTRLSEAVQPTREGKRDGGTFGRLSIAADEARALLATIPHKEPSAMSTFRLQIKCDNEAFSDGSLEPEVARILRRVAADVAEQGDRSGVCMDVNGNRVGSYTLTGGK